jgi:uncharacterized protein (DUF952 family)
MRFLYKILTASEWRDATAKGMFEGSDVDRRDGFIHLSASHQVKETAARHFAGQQGLVLVAFPEGDLDNLTWEPSRGGDLFPHIYGAIPARIAAAVHPLPLENGSHRFPPDLA